ncbi:hypothetical protein NKI79_15450 [Mesorhizobium sp. M0340]|uniref:hypothetical protein n=1 Tax=Mesorhizobium sp. M0340 TaxID=2956939 RepID=UPI0033363CA4
MKPAPGDEPNSADIVPISGVSQPTGSFAVPTKAAEYTDGRLPGDWQSKYPQAARSGINREACFLASLLVILALVSGLFLGFSGQLLQFPIPWLAMPTAAGVTPILTIDSRLLTIFFVGALGGTTFSIKWLVHSAAKCKWHLDRRYWRMFVPLIGGVYACVVLTLFDGGLIGAQSSQQPHSLATSAAFAFLVGYFSDGVSGLLSNIANAVFGTLEKK